MALGSRCSSLFCLPRHSSTEITENAAKYEEIYAEWSPNEKVALEVGIGASIAGGRALVAMKHVGVNVAATHFTVYRSQRWSGLVSADDPGMHSSQNEQDNRHFRRAAKIPIIDLRTVKNVKILSNWPLRLASNLILRFYFGLQPE